MAHTSFSEIKSNPDAPYYTNTTCWAIHEHQNCMKYGRPDNGFMQWKWKPDGCDLPVFNSFQFLDIVREMTLQSAANRPRTITTTAESSMRDAFAKNADCLNELVVMIRWQNYQQLRSMQSTAAENNSLHARPRQLCLGVHGQRAIDLSLTTYKHLLHSITITPSQNQNTEGNKPSNTCLLRVYLVVVGGRRLKLLTIFIYFVIVQICFKALQFETPSLRQAYIALQTWKSAIFSDPFNFTTNWNGPNVCSYLGVFCAPSPSDPSLRVVAGIDLNHADLAGYLPTELGLLPGLHPLRGLHLLSDHTLHPRHHPRSFPFRSVLGEIPPTSGLGEVVNLFVKYLNLSSVPFTEVSDLVEYSESPRWRVSGSSDGFKSRNAMTVTSYVASIGCWNTPTERVSPKTTIPPPPPHYTLFHTFLQTQLSHHLSHHYTILSYAKPPHLVQCALFEYSTPQWLSFSHF
ncbi:hypothetical protein CsSME_00053774 [Camellia sinensis var. sinensis]